MSLIDLAESGFLPDWAIRLGIRRLLRQGRKSHNKLENSKIQAELVRELRKSPLAVHTDSANDQHYEVPPEFFERALGARLKYSCCLYETGKESLDVAEIEMLDLTIDRAELADDMDILELGCGWGSLTLRMAERFSQARITAVSNSIGQREFILSKCEERGFDNVTVITADMREFKPSKQFDRVISVEMFEHMRNYQLLMERVSDWLRPQGKLFVHIFVNRDEPYVFETEGDVNWMGRHFFTGGIMPSEDLLLEFQDDLAIEKQWKVNGKHYWKTCEHWLQNQDAHRKELLKLFADKYDAQIAKLLFQRWRMFFMACAELFRYDDGEQWFVAHYLFNNQRKLADRSSAPQQVAST